MPISSGNLRIRFGERLRYLRKKAGLSQGDMSHEFGIDRCHISDLENHKKEVCFGTYPNDCRWIEDQHFRVNEGRVSRDVLVRIQLTKSPDSQFGPLNLRGLSSSGVEL